jgi:hypothetical protein
MMPSDPPIGPCEPVGQFIVACYPKSDELVVHSEFATLRELGAPIWYSQTGDILGSPNGTTILDDCAVFVVFITEGAIDSQEFVRNVTVAVDRMKRILVIHLVQEDPPEEFRRRIGDAMHIRRCSMDLEQYRESLDRYFYDLKPREATHGHEAGGVDQSIDLPELGTYTPEMRRKWREPTHEPVSQSTDDWSPSIPSYRPESDIWAPELNFEPSMLSADLPASVEDHTFAVPPGDPSECARAHPAKVDGDDVDCSVYAPQFASPGDTFLVMVIAHLMDQKEAASALALEFDETTSRRAARRLSVGVQPGFKIQVELRMPGLEIDQPLDVILWSRQLESATFGVNVPSDFSPGTVIGTVSISVNGLPAGHLKFKLSIDSTSAPGLPSEAHEVTAVAYQRAFLSYSTEDRPRVLQGIQELQAAGISFFQDLDTLRPGAIWEKELIREIDRCDLFLLYWSSSAKASSWVRKEVRYALDRQGDDETAPPEIRPLIIEGPPVPLPWEELAHLHFNDRIIYLMHQTGD